MLRKAAWIAIGAALMYVLDPDRGTRRRAQARDRAIGRAHDAREWAAGRARDLANRLRGIVAGARRRVSPTDVPSDPVLQDRVRSRIGHVVSRPGEIDVRSEAGIVILSGSVPEGEVDDLLAAVRNVEGVQSVIDRVRVGPETHDGGTGPGG